LRQHVFERSHDEYIMVREASFTTSRRGAEGVRHIRVIALPVDRAWTAP